MVEYLTMCEESEESEKKKYCAASLEKFEWLKQWIELKLCQLKYEESATSRVLLKAYIIISKTA